MSPSLPLPLPCSFLGLDPSLPSSELPLVNSRREALGGAGATKPQGWPMKREEYEALVDIVRPDAKRCAEGTRTRARARGRGSGETGERGWERGAADCWLVAPRRLQPVP